MDDRWCFYGRRTLFVIAVIASQLACAVCEVADEAVDASTVTTEKKEEAETLGPEQIYLAEWEQRFTACTTGPGSSKEVVWVGVDWPGAARGDSFPIIVYQVRHLEPLAVKPYKVTPTYIAEGAIDRVTVFPQEAECRRVMTDLAREETTEWLEWWPCTEGLSPECALYLELVLKDGKWMPSRWQEEEGAAWYPHYVRPEDVWPQFSCDDLVSRRSLILETKKQIGPLAVQGEQ
jgi:hypothetical protein